MKRSAARLWALRTRALLNYDRKGPDGPFVHGEEIAGSWPDASLVATTGLGHRAIPRDLTVVRVTVGFLREGAGG